MLVPVGPLQPVGIVVVAARDHRHEVQRLDEREMRRCPHEACRLGGQLVSPVDGLGSRHRRVELLDLGDQLVPGLEERRSVPHRGQSARRDDLGLEAVRHDAVDVVAQHVARLGLDHLGRFENVALGGPPLLDRVQLLGGPLGEHVLEDLIEVATLGDGASCRPALVQDRHGCAVRLRLADRVGVDELPEDLVGALLLAHDDRRAGEADAGAVRQCAQKVRVQGAGVRAVRLIDEDDDRVALVEQPERLLLV